VASRVVQDRSGSLVRAGTWHRCVYSRMSGGSTLFTRSRGASIRYTFTGRGIAVVMPYGRGRGRAQIWVDGSLAGTVDTYRSTLAVRRIVFSRAWTASRTHVVRIVNLGTAGRRRVDVDAFLVIQ
jgi:hypothetical protein